MKIKPKKDNIKIARFLLYFFLSVMVFFIYLTSSNIIKSISGNIKSINWVQIDAKLLHASIKITQSRRGVSNSTTTYTYYAPQVSYEYNFNNINCISTKVAWVEGGDDDGPLKELAYSLKHNFKNNIPIKVFANPDKPCESVIDRAIHWSTLTTMGVLLILTVFFSCGIVYLLVKIPKR